MLIRKKVLALVTTGLSFGVSLVSSAQVFEKPIVSVKSVSLDSLTFKSISSTLFLNIENPNIWGIELKKVEYEVSINNIEKFASGETKKVIKIEKQSKDNPIEVPVNINNSKIFSVVKSIMSNPEKIEYKATGKVYFSTFVGDVPIPFSKSSYIDNSESIAKIKSQIKSLNFFNF